VANSSEREITAFLAKRGRDLRADDIDELRAMLTQVPPERYEEISGNVWEAVALVVNDPENEGDANVPDLDAEPDA
jgi:hypothetical protein